MSVLQEVKKEAQRFVLHNYGNLLSVDDPVFDEKEDVWKVRMKTEYPRLIRNDRPEERIVRTLCIQDLGAICVDKEVKILKDLSTSRSECLDILKTRLMTWEKRAENIIVRTSANELANTGMARVFLNPITTILANFLEDTDIISFEEVEKLRKTERYFQWICLLEDLDLIRKKPEGYTYGNLFTELRRKADDDSAFLRQVLAHVIKERYSLLKDVFRLRQFESLVHLDSCYYRPALEARHVLFQKSESLFRRYLAQYKNRSRLELPAILLELRNSQALNQDGPYYIANEQLFKQMLQESEEFITISAPRI